MYTANLTRASDLYIERSIPHEYLCVLTGYLYENRALRFHLLLPSSTHKNIFSSVRRHDLIRVLKICFFKKIFFNLCVYVSMHTVCRFLYRPKGTRFPGAVATQAVVSGLMWEKNPGPLQEQQVLLTTEPVPKLPSHQV